MSEKCQKLTSANRGVTETLRGDSVPRRSPIKTRVFGY